MTRNRASTFPLLCASAFLAGAALLPTPAYAGHDRHAVDDLAFLASSPEIRHHGHTQDASYQAPVQARVPFQIGTASWYGGSRWQGNRTSSGERFDENRLTAAHASLPLGSHVRVTLVDTDQSVVVTITDRPGTRRRVIDLSRGAAAALGMVDRGLAEVVLQPL